MYKYLVDNGEKTFFANEETSTGKKYAEILICQMIDLLIDNIYIKIGNHFFGNVSVSPWVQTVRHSWLICFCTDMKLNF